MERYTKENPAPATPLKLRTGEWGARCPADVKRGDTIEITTRSGRAWLAQVAAVVWTTEDTALVTTAPLGTLARSRDLAPTRAQGPRSGRRRRGVFDPS